MDEAKQLPALKRCPFCGYSGAEVTQHDRGSSTVWVHCDSCGADGPPKPWADEAVDGWNARALAAHQQQLPPHPEPRTHQWSSLERAAIERYGDARVAAALAAHQPSAAEPVATVYSARNKPIAVDWKPAASHLPPGEYTLYAAPAAAAPPVAVPVGARPLSEYHEDRGPVVWWTWADGAWIDDPAWIGRPDDDEWPGHHTHWTPHPALPQEPTASPTSDPQLQELFSATIDGALTFGYQGNNPPPEGHWLTMWWNKGRAAAEAEQRIGRNRDMWKSQCEEQAKRLTELAVAPAAARGDAAEGV